MHKLSIMKNTIVFIHGMFQNPKSWDKWITFFKARGYNCIAPAWPLHDGEPQDLRAFPPENLGDLELQTIVDSVESVVTSLDEKPIIIGHSVGGLIVQLLVNKGLAEMGVAIDSVAPNAMLAFDWGFMKNSALITNPFKGNEPFYMDPDSFHESFANTLTKEESDKAWSEFAVHDSRNVLRDCMGEAGHIDLDATHQPLLFIGGSEDQIIPASLNQKNAEAYTDEVSITEFKEFAGRGHYICGQPGWDEVAGYIADWLQKHEELQYHTSENVGSKA
jgi:pimeloyl-ACP methyl ester carboxylesterase